MKKNLCLNIIVLLFPLCANSQSVDSLSLYQSAITFISADLDILQKEVAVSGIAYDLDCFMFIDSVKNSSLEEILHEKQDKPTPDVYSSILDRNFNKLSPQTEYSIFFSRIKDGFFPFKKFIIRSILMHIVGILTIIFLKFLVEI